jgi:hypothetical protein
MIPEVPDLAEKEVVGRANGRHLSLDHIKAWVSSHWRDLGFPLPSVHTLAKGWFLFKFQTTTDVCRVLHEASNLGKVARVVTGVLELEMFQEDWKHFGHFYEGGYVFSILR